jgi:hypothetical protein
MKDGDVGGPWVIVKHWRCEPAFFAYFLCGGKESECRPAQGQRMKDQNHTADASTNVKPKTQNPTTPREGKTPKNKKAARRRLPY